MFNTDIENIIYNDNDLCRPTIAVVALMEIFMQKASAANIEILVKALLQIAVRQNHSIETIGTLYKEKNNEALCSRPEMSVGQDQGEYYRIPTDDRDLNYSKFHGKGGNDLSTIECYNLHNSQRPNVAGMIKLLHKLELVGDIGLGGTNVPEGV